MKNENLNAELKALNENESKSENRCQNESNHKIWMFWTQRRYILVVMLMLACTVMFTLRINLSVAIIPMTRNVTNENGVILKESDLNWNSKEQGIVLSAFFYGSIFTQLPGALLAKRFNGARVYGIAMGSASVLTLLTPLAANYFYTMLLIRILQGLFLGITLPVQMALISKWAPVKERARMTMFANSGLYFGIVIALQFSGLICDYLNWTFAFYIFGAIGLIWYGFWLLLIKETPEKDTKITEQEKNLILTSIGDQGKRDITIPWMSIFKSVPFWALICAHFAHFWLAFTSMTYLPKFFSDIMKVKTSQTGFFSGLPYLINGIASNFAGVVADKLLSKGYFNVVQTRKLFTCVSFFIQSTLLLCLTFYMTPVMSFIIMTTVLTCSAFAMTGFWVNFIDIAPQFTGILFALSNTIAAISGIIAPTLTGFIVQNGEVDEWKLVFYISAAVCLIGAILYGIGAQGHVQSWAVIPVKEEKMNEIELDENEADLNNRQNPNNINIYSTSSKTDILN